MNKEMNVVKELFKQANNSELINGFLLDNGKVKFQANDGTMVLLKIVPLEQNMDNETNSTTKESE